MTVVDSDGTTTTWTRPSGNAGDIVGTWTWTSPFFSYLDVLTFNSDGTFSISITCKIATASSWIYSSLGYYFAGFSVRDPNQQYTSVTVTGPGISGSLSLTYDARDGWWKESSFPSVIFGSTPPTPPLTYTFALNSTGGTTYLTDDIESFVPLVTNLSPSGGQTVSAPPTFSWTGGGAGYSYLVGVYDSNGFSIWGTGLLTTTSVVYAGPTLTSGVTYRYSVLMYDTYGNGSWVYYESFVVQ